LSEDSEKRKGPQHGARATTFGIGICLFIVKTVPRSKGLRVEALSHQFMFRMRSDKWAQRGAKAQRIAQTLEKEAIKVPRGCDP